MKYIVLVGDGMGDNPVEQLGGKTPLQAAKTPNMDRLARNGALGLVRLTPDGFSPGSDVTQLSLLGYDPRKCYTGRSPLEAASIGVSMDKDDVAYRCNLVTLTRDGDYISANLSDDVVMEDYSGGHIGTDEARELILSLDKSLGKDNFRFYAGVSYRHLFIWKHGETDLKSTPPHDFTGKVIKGRLPQGKGVDVLTDLMEKALKILKTEDVRNAESSRQMAYGSGGRVKRLLLKLFTKDMDCMVL
jgi:2,3-bisphosphoglycerate-independent phosphoglycerate mutase